MTKLDYTVESPEERKKIVEKILEEVAEPSPEYLNTLSDYIIFCMDKQERKERRLLTQNRMTTVNKRETSFENLVSQFENGEDGIYNLITENKSTIFQPKAPITEEDLNDIPELRQIREAITFWEEKGATLSGHSAYVAKQAVIELRKDQYVVRNAYRRPIQASKLTRTSFPTVIEFNEWIDEKGNLRNSGISLMNPQVCQITLCNYSRLKEDSYEEFDADMKYYIQTFEETVDRALEKFPLYQRLLEYKIDGMQNVDIQARIEGEFGIKHSVEYLSSLWRKKIPKLIAEQAELDYLNWYYTNIEKGTYKKCSRCGEYKLACNKYFSRNKTSKDSFYSICKKCRNAKSEIAAEIENEIII